MTHFNQVTKLLAFLIAILSFNPLFAQSKFNPQQLFATYPKSTVTPYRAANGAPGNQYWQNRANYKIEASIDTNKNLLNGYVEIEYVNNSPDDLNSLWLQIEQNTYKKDAISQFSRGRKNDQFTNGMEMTEVAVKSGSNASKADYLLNGTLMQIRLTQPLKSGEKRTIVIRYHYEIPGSFGGRTDYYNSKNGKVYEIAQWYPRMCVYDDLNGWNTLPFIGTGEFYLEYGDFDYKITVPTGVMVVGSGEVVNPTEVYSKAQRDRLEKASQSDKTILIRTKDEMLNDVAISRKVNRKSTVTWHFQMKNTRDVAFGASAAFIIDAAKINLPDGKKALAMSAYPEESIGLDAWSRSTEYLKGAVEHFSEMWAPYPYPVAINLAGTAGGMEYPGIVFDGLRAKKDVLFWVTAHEIGHTWFPMVVGSNERLHAWMDEGLNTFIDVYASDAFNNGEYAPKRDGEYAPGGGNPADEIIPWIQDENSPTLLERADRITGKYRHPFTYFKPAFGLIMLREEILGKERFDYAFKTYYERWANKHPGPDDFFRTMENESGEDLSYFWRQWFEYNWEFDVAVDSVVANTKNGYSTIHLQNMERSAYPLNVRIDYENGQSEKLRLPIEVWYGGAQYNFRVHHTSPIKSVVVDPEKKLPDGNRENNEWKR